jgi:hypothetical protein
MLCVYCYLYQGMVWFEGLGVGTYVVVAAMLDATVAAAVAAFVVATVTAAVGAIVGLVPVSELAPAHAWTPPVAEQ